MIRGRAPRSVTKGAIAAAVKQQRLDLAGLGLLNLAQVDGVISTIERRIELALEMGQHTLEDRSPVGSAPVRHALEFLTAADREAARDVFLVFGEDVQSEDLALLEGRVALRFLVHADHEQRGNQRQ